MIYMKKTVYAYLHTHWDREWYRNKEDFNIRLQNVFDIILDELKNNAAPFFYFDGQVCALLDYLKYNPEKSDLVKKLIKKNKLAIGPYFVSADTYLASFPFMLKNLDLGIEYSKKFNQKDFIGYLSDVFGVSKSAFYALNIKNINKAAIWRGVNPNDINNDCNFIYQNINTLWLSMGYFNDFLHNKNIEALKDYLDKIFKYSDNNCLLPIGADHLGILKNSSKIISEINKKLDDYKIILTSPFEYFKNNKFINKAKCSEFLDNSKTYILQGVYSARIYQKYKNYLVQNKLSKIVEPLNFYLKGKYSNYIEEIYKTILKNHAHDSIYGCSLDEVAHNVDNRFNKANQALDSILLHILSEFKNSNNINSKSIDKIGLFNLTNSDNLDTVKIKLPYILKNSQVIKTEKKFSDELLSDCYKIPVTEDICNIYTQIVEINNNNNKFSFNTVKIKKPKVLHKIDNNFIKNKYIALNIEDNKIAITNKNNKIYLKLTDIKDDGDSYNFAPSGKRNELKLMKSEVLYKGEIQSALRLYFKDIELDVFLNNHSRFLKFSANILNKKKNHKLQLSLIFPKNITKTTAQDAIGIIQRKHNPNYKMEDNMPAMRPIELKTNSYPMQSFVQCQKGIILTKGLQEYEIYQNELRICLLRCIGTISNPKNKARAIPAGPDLKIPDAQLLGRNEAEFAILFGNIEQAFLNLDKFSENYATIDGKFDKNLNIEFDKLDNKTYFYGINKNKKILYNFDEDKIILK